MPPKNRTTTDDATSTDDTAGALIEPLDGPVYDPATATDEPIRPEGSRGQTLLRTRRGYQHDTNVEGIPAITSAGVYVTAAQAEEILAEAEPFGTVYIDKEGE